MTNSTTIIDLKTKTGACATINLHGGHLVSWKPVPALQEQLYLSDLACLDGTSAIRGGVPILFPQFGSLGDYVWHGFARTSLWQHVSTTELNNNQVCGLFNLRSSDKIRDIWPFEFELVLSVILSDSNLELRYEVHNVDTKPFVFSGGLHTYFATDDITQTQLIGLGECAYSEFGQDYRQSDDKLNFNKPIDRIYPLYIPHQSSEQGQHQTEAAKLRLNSPNRSIDIASTGFTDVVVWNPWQNGAKEIADMQNDDYKKMVCVEAVMASKKINLKAGERWQGSQHLSYSSSEI